MNAGPDIPTPEILKRSHEVYVDWLFESDGAFGYGRGWVQHSPRLLFWYAIAGVPRGGEDLAWRWLTVVDEGGISDLPEPRRRNWREAQSVSAEIYEWTRSALVPWLAGLREHSVLGWLKLQEIYLIGPKVSSWVMRDVSFMADYASKVKPTELVYREKRDSRWFMNLTPEAQACFVPIDAWVFKYAKCAGALSPSTAEYGLAGIQSSPENHRMAATEIVKFAQQRDLDPRDLNSFWYQLGSEAIDRQGREKG